MSVLQIAADDLNEDFWEALSLRGQLFLSTVDSIEVVGLEGNVWSLLASQKDLIPKSIIKRFQNKVLQGNKEIIRSITMPHPKSKTLYQGVYLEDVPFYSHESESPYLFSSDTYDYERLKQIRGWREFISKAILPYKAWIYWDKYFFKNSFTTTPLLELIHGPNGNCIPGVVVVELKKGATELECNEHIEKLNRYLLEATNKTCEDLGVTVVFTGPQIHARAIVTNNNYIHASHSMNMYWKADGTLILRTLNDTIIVQSGFIREGNGSEIFDIIEKQWRNVVRGKKFAFGRKNWQRDLNQWFA